MADEKLPLLATWCIRGDSERVLLSSVFADILLDLPRNIHCLDILENIVLAEVSCGSTPGQLAVGLVH